MGRLDTAAPRRAAAATYAFARALYERFRAHQTTDRAAALTYYALLSLFPSLLVMVGLLGMLGQESTIVRFTDYLADNGAPEEVVDAVTSSLDVAIDSRGTASAAFAIGLVIALYGASRAFDAAGRALNVVFGVAEESRRGFVVRRLRALAATLVLVLLGAVTLLLMFLGGEVAHDLLEGSLGLGSAVADTWLVVRWPAAILVAMVVYALAYQYAPARDVRGRPKLLTPGAALGVLAWIAVSWGFGQYVSNFSSYNATYGAFATVVVLLVWLWLGSVIFLLGAEVNAELLERRRRRAGERPR